MIANLNKLVDQYNNTYHHSINPLMPTTLRIPEKNHIF